MDPKQRLTPTFPAITCYPGYNSTEYADNRQAYKSPTYLPNGAIYLSTTASMLEHREFATSNVTTVGYVMPAERSVDIDTRLDLLLAEALLVDAELAAH